MDAAGFFVMGDEALFRIWQLSGSGEGLYVWVQGSPGRFRRHSRFVGDPPRCHEHRLDRNPVGQGARDLLGNVDACA